MKTFLDWSRYKDAGMGDAYADIPKHGGDFAKAIAVCINSKQCETDNKLVMCPSYKVTKNPNLSPGGRVRLLKTALSDDLVQEALADPALQEALDLCLSCKGCKRECESNVDMPLIKAEYLAQVGAQKGYDLRARLLAHMPVWLHAYRWSKHLIKFRNSSAFIAKVGKTLLRIDDKQALPVPASQQFDGRDMISDDTSRREVVLFADTFSRYFEPENLYCAQAVLEAAGYRVVHARPATNQKRPLCCGRTYLAQGMVERARAEAERLCDSLLPHIEAGRSVIGLEASCVLGLRDDAKAYGLGEKVMTVASQTLLLEEFITRELRAKRFDLTFRPQPGKRVLVHGHCHQKAVGAMKAMRRVLKLIPDLDFEIIDSGCCGMAGSFGIEAEHAEMSSKLAETSLMPTLRQEPEAGVVANGFSCRQQIRAHGDMRPVHIAKLLSQALN